jgi:NitT/TauT family transport system permease protein
MRNYKVQNLLQGLIGVSLFCFLWQIASQLGLINPFFISSPTNIAKEIFLMFGSGSIFPHLAISIQEFIVGFGLAVIFAVVGGLLLGWYSKINSFLSILIYALYSTPNIALLPLIIIWFGLGIPAKVAFVFLAAFFPILINTIGAVKNLEEDYVMLARSFGAKDLYIFLNIAVPAAIPFVMAGLRIAVARGLVGMVVAEFFVSNKGLGYLITFYGSTFQTSKLLAVVLIIIIISLLMKEGIGLIERKFRTWKLEV